MNLDNKAPYWLQSRLSNSASQRQNFWGVGTILNYAGVELSMLRNVTNGGLQPQCLRENQGFSHILFTELYIDGGFFSPTVVGVQNPLMSGGDWICWRLPVENSG